MEVIEIFGKYVSSSGGENENAACIIVSRACFCEKKGEEHDFSD
nr:hypothetical protein [Anaerobacillus isosaccharinicus]